ncbi:hypothetical protein [Shimia sp.]|uniref:hypothetical protein n=1 Tax=Shimia sp. TaxID=1954381 RepID=UPI0035640272
MLSFLALGLVVGMAHALEADHLAAVGTLATKNANTRRRLAWLGASWGLGHTTTLFLLSLPVLLLGFVLTARIEAGLEVGVGLMLVALGVGVLVRMRRDKVHFHLHDHRDGARHFHVHSHGSAQTPHHTDRHDHEHRRLFSGRSYVVGLIHGAAGSAGLVALAAAATQDLGVTFLYILLFGLGSTLGMALLTCAASWPLQRAEVAAGRFFLFAQGAMACFAVAVGLGVVASAGPIMLGVG